MFGHEKGAFTGAISKRIGKFAQADGGTLFLDEIAEMPARLQAKLLRVLEGRQITPVGGNTDQEVDFRLICATNRDLAREVGEQRFRKDLYFRINVFTIQLPALREIRRDIPSIAQHHLGQLAAKMGRPQPQLSSDLTARLQEYDYPGNVRELRNILEHLLIVSRGDTLSAEHLAKMLAPALGAATEADLPLKDAVRKFEIDYIRSTVSRCNGNLSRAAEELGLDRSYLYRKLRQLGIE
jgi:two-component system nitrogen regulation response regulator NtrX